VSVTVSVFAMTLCKMMAKAQRIAHSLQMCAFGAGFMEEWVDRLEVEFSSGDFRRRVALEKENVFLETVENEFH
jgi:hypothetical protein